jgi:hypothetical protein
MQVSELLDQPRQQPARSEAPTGLHELDCLVGGFNVGQFWVVTGAPGQGRSTLLTQWAGVLGVEHGWQTMLHSARDEPQQCLSRVVASLSRVPMTDLGRPTELAEAHRARIDAAEQSLRAAPMFVDFGRAMGVPPSWNGDGPPTSRALLLDDVDLIGIPPHELRALADKGSFVAVSLPRHLVVDGRHPDGDLEPHWAQSVDLILELRTHGHTSRGEQVGPGEVIFSVLRNRRGPALEFKGLNHCWRGGYSNAAPTPPGL